MPRIYNDVMVELTPEDKSLIKKIGYDKCASILGKSEDYIRGLASKGKRKMRQTDLEKLDRAREWGY